MSLRKALIAAIVCTAAVGLVACSATADEPPPEPTKLTVGLNAFLSWAPFFIAQEEGFFAEQNLEVEFVRFSAPNDAIPPLIAGELDVAAGLVTVNALNAIAQGGSLKYVADKGYADPNGCSYTTFMARQELLDSGQLDDLNQVAGLSFSVSAATSAEYYLDKVLESAGRSSEDVELVEVIVPVRLEALVNGTLDVAAVSEPWATRILNSGAGDYWQPLEQVIPDFQLGFVIYGPNLLEDDREAGQRFMVAYLKAIQAYSELKTERNLEIMAQYTELDVELLEEACWQSFRADGSINIQSVLDFQSWAQQKGYLLEPATPEQFWDASFIEFANQELAEAQGE
jgi:NitT/TauT family transport system substrate-binding protein